MNLNFEISFSNILLDGFKCLLLPGISLLLLFMLLFLYFECLMNLIHLPSLFQKFGSRGNSFKLHMSRYFGNQVLLFLHEVTILLLKLERTNQIDDIILKMKEANKFKIISNFNSSLSSLIFIFSIIPLFQVQCYNKFCSVLCQNQSCTSSAFGQCTACEDPWQWNSTTGKCDLKTQLGWTYLDFSTDIGGNITSNITQMSTCSQPLPTSWSYRYFGNVTGQNVIKFMDSKGPQHIYYQIRIIFWMVLLDSWTISNIIFFNFNDTLSSAISRNILQTSQAVCGDSLDQQDYIRFDKTYNYNKNGSYHMQITTDSNSSSWGIKQVIVLVRQCNKACLSCFGYLASQCYTCEVSTPMYQSGTTCNESCLIGYGQNMSYICIKCDSLCQKCYMISNNCSKCVSSSFYYAVNNTCNVSCLSSLYTNYTDRNCYDCDPNRSLLLLNGNCVYCPEPNCIYCNNNSVCTACQQNYNLSSNNKCIECNINSCLLCLSTNTCSSCPTAFNLFNNLCIQCDIAYCSLCKSTNLCQSCPTSYNLFNNTCILCNISMCQLCQTTNLCSSCPSAYNLVNNTCISCNVGNCSMCQSNNICSSCPPSFTLLNNLCIQCSIANCTRCTSTNTCNSCLSSYTLSNNSCTQCGIANCTMCSSANVCSSCPVLYNLSNNVCILCNISLCLSCISPNNCSTCASPSTLLNGICMQCNIANCTTCIQANKCDSCANQTKLFNHNCYICTIQNCLACSSNNICETCVKDHQLSNKKCTIIQNQQQKSQTTTEKQKTVTIAIIVTCSFIVFFICMFIIGWCIYKNKIKNNPNQVRNQFKFQRQETKEYIDNIHNTSSSRKFDPKIHRQNSINYLTQISDNGYISNQKSYKSDQKSPTYRTAKKVNRFRKQKSSSKARNSVNINQPYTEQDNISDIQVQIQKIQIENINGNLRKTKNNNNNSIHKNTIKQQNNEDNEQQNSYKRKMDSQIQNKDESLVVENKIQKPSNPLIFIQDKQEDNQAQFNLYENSPVPLLTSDNKIKDDIADKKIKQNSITNKDEEQTVKQVYYNEKSSSSYPSKFKLQPSQQGSLQQVDEDEQNESNKQSEKETEENYQRNKRLLKSKQKQKNKGEFKSFLQNYKEKLKQKQKNKFKDVVGRSKQKQKQKEQELLKMKEKLLLKEKPQQKEENLKSKSKSAYKSKSMSKKSKSKSKSKSKQKPKSKYKKNSEDIERKLTWQEQQVNQIYENIRKGYIEKQEKQEQFQSSQSSQFEQQSKTQSQSNTKRYKKQKSIKQQVQSNKISKNKQKNDLNID